MQDTRRRTDQPRTASSPDPARRRMTAREQEVALLVGAGLKDALIAKRLGLSVSTVRTYSRHIQGRLNLTGREALVSWVAARQTPAHPQAGLHRLKDVAET